MTPLGFLLVALLIGMALAYFKVDEGVKKIIVFGLVVVGIIFLFNMFARF